MSTPRTTHLPTLMGALMSACISCSAHAGWQASDLDKLTSSFTAGISRAYGVTASPWQFLSCDASSTNCFGTNPDSPYSSPDFGASAANAHSSSTKMKALDALVVIMETPPTMRYFGLTPYIITRYYPSAVTGSAATPGFVPVFESLGDTANLRDMGTTGSSTAGSNAFSQLSVSVMTADQQTAKDVKAQLIGLGFPSSAINLMAIPINAVPLHMGQAPTSDTYSILLRMAYPQYTWQMKDYISRAPLRVLSLTPLQATRAPQNLPTPLSRVPGSQPAESTTLADARDALIEQLKAQFKASYDITRSPAPQMQTQNYVCVTHALPCNGDNPDAIYSGDVQGLTPTSKQDRILIVGVNHVSQGKATYLSHAIVAHANNMGVKGVSDTWLAGTGLKAAGITDPSDPRYATYSQLYAFTLSYDCGNDPLCVTIPEVATADQPYTIPFGQALDITGRVYLDPQTNTRPSTNDIITHKVFIMQKH